MNKLIEFHGSLEAIRTIKTAGFALFAEPKIYSDFGKWPAFAGYAPLTSDVLTQRLADSGINATVTMSDDAIRMVENTSPEGELVGVLRLGSVDYV